MAYPDEMKSSYERWAELWELPVNNVYPKIRERVAGVDPYCPWVKPASVKDRPKHSNGKVVKQAVSSTSTQTFHPFPRLPIEIRLKVWKNALPGPRIITLKCVDFVQMYMQYQEKKFRTVYSVITDTKTPVVLHVNQEARYEGSKVYTLDFGFWILCGPIFFDFNRDTLHFEDVYSLRSFLVGELDASQSEIEDERAYLYENLRHVMLGGDLLPGFAYDELFRFVQKCDFRTLTLQKQDIICEGSYFAKVLVLDKVVNDRRLSLVKKAEEDRQKISELPQLRYLNKREMKALAKPSKKEKTPLEQHLFKNPFEDFPFSTTSFQEDLFDNGFHHVTFDEISARLHESTDANSDTTEDAVSSGPCRSARFADIALVKQQEQ
ncbi:hypothetical protein B7494_g6021 [Chlorociboria aeruginascens]|nr:hypothetical protein B7494_g6021 [Chlorociboria aeruginascens]